MRSISKARLFVVLLCALVICYSFSTENTFARKAGGGDLAEFDTGEFVTGVGFGFVAMGVGSVVGSLVTGGLPVASAAVKSLSTVTTWAGNLNTLAAVTQISNAIGQVGAYKGWDPGVTRVISSTVSGVAGGVINPGAYLNSATISTTVGTAMATNMAQGALVGGAQGLASGVITTGLVGSSGRYEPWMSVVGGLGGSMVGNTVAALVSPTIGVTAEAANGNQVTVYRPAEGLGEAIKYAAQSTFNPTSLGFSAANMGIGYITQNMDPQDAFMVNQVVSGAKTGYFGGVKTAKKAAIQQRVEEYGTGGPVRTFVDTTTGYVSDAASSAVGWVGDNASNLASNPLGATVGAVTAGRNWYTKHSFSDYTPKTPRANPVVVVSSKADVGPAIKNFYTENYGKMSGSTAVHLGGSQLFKTSSVYRSSNPNTNPGYKIPSID